MSDALSDGPMLLIRGEKNRDETKLTRNKHLKRAVSSAYAISTRLVPVSRVAGLRTLAPSHTIRQAKRTATSSRMDARHRTAIVETRGGPLVSGKSAVLQMTCRDGVVAVFLEAFCYR